MNRDLPSGLPDVNDPIDLKPVHFAGPTNHIELRTYANHGTVETRVIVNGQVFGAGFGRTFGEALMNAGALMAGYTVGPTKLVDEAR